MTIHSKEITREIQSDARWIRAGAKGYWSTLTWRNYQVCGDAPIPMISENSLPVLSKILDIRIQNSAGIVFGVVPKGWKIRLAGRAEKPIVIDSDKNPSSMDAIEIDRSFLFLNVSPGTHVLRISPAQNGSTDRVHASVVLPVVEGHATHVNLGKIHSVSLKGTVIDGASAMSQAVSGVTLKVVGANIKIKTEPSGKFEIPAAYQVSNYPLWIDAHAESGYTHRYRVSKRLGDLKFYLFSSDYIRGLLDQLSGLVHPDAGLLLGTAPALAAKAEASTLLPTAGVVSGESTMFPEAYTLSTDNRLLTETPLDNQTYRFAALLPEGVNLMELVDKSQRARWSEMVFSSPGIVNITDPK
jgi:hypothetical protein